MPECNDARGLQHAVDQRLFDLPPGRAPHAAAPYDIVIPAVHHDRGHDVLVAQLSREGSPVRAEPIEWCEYHRGGHRTTRCEGKETDVNASHKALHALER